MRHTNFKEKQKTFQIINKSQNDLAIYKFTKVGGITVVANPTITAIGDFFKIEITNDNEDYFLLVKWGELVEILRVGDPEVLVLFYGEAGKTYAYTQFGMDGAQLDAGNVTEIEHGFYYIEPVSLDKSFYNVDGNILTLSVPYKVMSSDAASSPSQFINKGYNMFGFLGNRHSSFDLAQGKWLDDENSTAKASDLAKSICSKYSLEWDDRNAANWIGKYVKYIRTYYENADQKVFKLYSPSITPENNSNNFDLVQDDELGHKYVRGVSLLLLQDLDDTIATDGAIMGYTNG